MKSLLFIGISLVFSLFTDVFAQCNPYFPYDKGTSLTTTSYNAKGKEEGSQKMTVTGKSGTASREVMQTDITLYDKKGKEVITNEIELICENGLFRMDLSRFAPPGMGESEGISVSYEGEGVRIPSKLSVGETLPDGNFIMKVSTDNPELTGMMGGSTVKVTDRKVVAKESITTPAGTFDCYKITANSTISTKVMGMTRTMNTSSVEWISENVGMVRVESYDQKNKLSTYTVLTAFSK